MKKFFIAISFMFAINCYSMDKFQIIQMIKESASKSNVDPTLALAVADVESKFNPQVKKFEPKFKTYSVGIFQIFVPTSRSLGFTGSWQDLLSPKININLGIRHLQICTERFGANISLIACCHNAGYAVKQSVCENNSNVKAYVTKVMLAYKQWQFQKIAYN